MTLTALPLPAPATRRAASLPALLQLVGADLRRMTRNPMFAVGTVGFPILFFALFGLPNVRETAQVGGGRVNVAQLVLASFGVYSLLSLAMFSFGSAIAAERTGGWLRLLRASPLPTGLYFAARIVGALTFGAAALTLLYAFAHFAGGVTLPLGLALTLLGKLLLGLIPLIALGLFIGFAVNPQAAQITAQLVSVLMSFASGIFVPLNNLPDLVQRVAPYLPAYHLGQIASGTVAHQTAHEAGHWLALLAFGLVFGALAVRGMQRDESREG